MMIIKYFAFFTILCMFETAIAQQDQIVSSKKISNDLLDINSGSKESSLIQEALDFVERWDSLFTINGYQEVIIYNYKFLRRRFNNDSSIAQKTLKIYRYNDNEIQYFVKNYPFSKEQIEYGYDKPDIVKINLNDSNIDRKIRKRLSLFRELDGKISSFYFSQELLNQENYFSMESSRDLILKIDSKRINLALFSFGYGHVLFFDTENYPSKSIAEWLSLLPN